jgi:hypothetical protein
VGDYAVKQRQGRYSSTVSTNIHKLVSAAGNETKKKAKERKDRKKSQQSIPL